MVKAIVDLDEKANKVINTIKGMYGLSNKSQAINKLAKLYREKILGLNINTEREDDDNENGRDKRDDGITKDSMA